MSVSVIVIIGILVICLIGVGVIMARLYRRASKKMAFVKTGLGGEKVIKDAGCVVLPIFHEIIPVNMETLKIEIRKENEEGLITKDKQLIDVSADFFVKVTPEETAIAKAAQTLGDKLTDVKALREFIESKFIDALRSVAATMEMENLHEERSEFVRQVQETVSEDLSENGLQLESVSLKSLDQTSIEYYKDNNVFNAEGLAKTTEIIQRKKEEKNKVLQDTEVAIAQKNMEAEKQRLEIKKKETYNRLEQEKEIEVRKAEQEALIKAEQALKDKEAQEATIKASQETRTAEIIAAEALSRKKVESDKAVNESEILKQKAIRRAEIEKEREIEQASIEKEQALEQATLEKNKALEKSQQELEQAQIEKEKAVETSKLAKAIEIAEKQKAESEAQTEAERARKEYVKEQEDVKTAVELAEANREKEKEIIRATKESETKSIGIKVSARAEKEAQLDRAEAVTIEAKAAAEKITIESEARKNADLKDVEVLERKYKVEADGKQAIHEAENALSAEQIKLKIHLALIEKLPEIIAASVKPAEHIDEIKLVQVSGMGGNDNRPVTVKDGEKIQLGEKKNMFEGAKDAMLDFQVQKTLIQKIFKEIGYTDDIDKLPSSIFEELSSSSSSSSSPSSSSKPAAAEKPSGQHKEKERHT